MAISESRIVAGYEMSQVMNCRCIYKAVQYKTVPYNKVRNIKKKVLRISPVQNSSKSWIDLRFEKSNMVIKDQRALWYSG